MDHLLTNSTLQNGKYRIISVLGQGGFGITYLASQVILDRKVAIKEFFMKDLCERDDESQVTFGTTGSRNMVQRFRDKFLKEAQHIAKLKHPNIVHIIDAFEENGTTYYVMDYAEEGSLSAKVKELGYLSEPLATDYILQVADALDYIHHFNMNHLDVKPANIMLNTKTQVVLIDFGLSKQYDAATGSQTSTTPVGISEGYAPMEQYKQGGVGEFSPETDIYALGATYFKLLTGVTPPSASDVYEDGIPVGELKAKKVSQNAINTIIKAMEARKRDRWSSAREFINSLKGSSSASEETLHIDDIEEEKTVLVSQPKEDDGQDYIHRIAMEKYMSQKKAAAEQKAIEEEMKRIKEEEERRLKAEEEERRRIAEQQELERRRQAEEAERKRLEEEKRRKYEEEQARRNRNFNINGVSFRMKLVEHGTFQMGEKHSFFDSDRENDLHTVTISHDYYIGELQVTQQFWSAVMGSNPSRFKGEKWPVDSVSYIDCQEFIKKINAITNRKFRLPTEAEWEFAARGGNTSSHRFSGNDSADNVAWYINNSNNSTHQVGLKEPNELGLYDMSGNVSEWCNDYYAPYKSSSEYDPTGPKSGNFRVHRGGGYSNTEKSCTVYSRSQALPNASYAYLGLRLALD